MGIPKFISFFLKFSVVYDVSYFSFSIALKRSFFFHNAKWLKFEKADKGMDILTGK